MAKRDEILGIPLWLLAIAAAAGIYYYTKKNPAKAAQPKLPPMQPTSPGGLDEIERQAAKVVH